MTAAKLRDVYQREGWWTDETFAEFIDRRVDADPSLRVRIWSDVAPRTTTIGEVHDRSRRIAAGLRDRGIGPGDVVAYQMPSWAETLEVLWAGFRLGATMVPIIHFYGPTEVAFILAQSKAQALVTVGNFGGIDHLANLESIRADLELETIVVADTAARVRVVPGAVALSDLMDHPPHAETSMVDPDQPAMIGYTSGTTAEPKGVIHSHRSLLAEVRQPGTLNVAGGRPSVMASPLAHMTGMLGGSLVPLHNGDPIELLDRWDPGRVLGRPGEILSRGPDLFIGYTDATLTAEAIDAEGWYHTGDVGTLDTDGYLTITDRLSDLIIRGGLNLSAAKIEEHVATMPGIAEVAVVAAPDARLGEHACAVVRATAGSTAVDLPSLHAHLATSGLPKQQWPEEVRSVEDFDRTPSGKIKKRTLRSMIAADPR